MQANFRLLSVAILLAALFGACASKPPLAVTPYSQAQVDPQRYDHASDCCSAKGKQYAIAAGGEASSRAGARMLDEGGNVVDAAVAMAFCLAVERPHSTGLSGGGFMMIHLNGKPGGDFFVDFREMAPHRASRDMYLDHDGKVVSGLSETGALSVATPGMVAGLAEIHHQWGKLTWKQVLAPAVALAEKGFPVYRELAQASEEMGPKFPKGDDIRRLFYPGGRPLKVGERLVQKDLADTLRRIAAHGKVVFYEGTIAKRMVSFLARQHGLVDKEDLARYRPKMRPPLSFDWKGYHLVTAPPESAGGVMLEEMLNVLGGFDLAEQARDQAGYAHLLSEVMKRAYADRSLYVGDPDFVSPLWTKILSPSYADKIRDHIDFAKNTPSEKVRPGEYAPETHGTTQLSLLDKDGNAISSTLTINASFGALLVVPGTGIVLNDEMDDFSAKPGTQNLYGLTGSDANAIAPGKRPVSSMTPTLVFRDGKTILAVGGAGGSRIVSGVTQTILNDLVIIPGDVRHAVFASRVHQQWLPDRVDLDPGFQSNTWERLKAMKHEVSAPEWDSVVQAAGRDSEGELEAATDPRKTGGVQAK